MKKILTTLLSFCIIISMVAPVYATDVVANGNIITVSGNFDSSYSGQQATVILLNPGYKLDDINDISNYNDVIAYQNVVDISSQGILNDTFELESMDKEYTMVVQCADFMYSRKFNPSKNHDFKFDNVWLNVENSNITVNAKITNSDTNYVSLVYMKPGYDYNSQNFTYADNIAVVDVNKNGYICTADGIKGYTFKTDVTEVGKFYIISNGEVIYTRELNPTINIDEDEYAGVMNVDFGLEETYPALTGTTQERFEAAVAELPDEVKTLKPFNISGDYEIFVSPEGNDNNEGTISNPVKTLQKALEIRKQYSDAAGVVIYMRGGEYYSYSTINVTDNGGTENQKPLIISSYNNETVTLSGARKINNSAFKPVMDTEAYSRLSFDVRDKIVCANLSDLGIDDIDSFISSAPDNIKIYCNGEPMTLSRWPNADNVKIGQIIDTGTITASKTPEQLAAEKEANGGTYKNVKFAIDHGEKYGDTNNRPAKWKQTGSIYINGHLSNDFSLNNVRIKEITYNTDLSSYAIELVSNIPYGAKTSGTNPFLNYYYYNVLEELDTPGEWYIDRETNKIYIYPTENINSCNLSMYTGSQSIMKLDSTSNVIINGIKFKYAAGNGVVINKGYQNVVQNCEISDLGGIGVNMIDGVKNGVIYTSVHNNYGRAIYMSVNDINNMLNLTPSRNFVQNCYCYAAPMEEINSSLVTSGTGVIVSHNLVQNSGAAPMGISSSQECIVEYNEIVGGPVNTQDSAGIYLSGSKYSRGNHIRYNYVHDLSKTITSRALIGIYFDDTSSGNYAYGNMIVNVPSGLYSHNGAENVFFNNMIIGDGTQPGYYLHDEFNYYNPYGRINSRWAANGGYYPNGSYNKYFDILDYDNNTAWKGRYPTFKTFIDGLNVINAQVADELAACGDNVVTDLTHTVTDREMYLRTAYDCYYANNFAYKYLTGIYTNEKNIRLVSRNYLMKDGDPGFVNAANGDYRLKKDSVLLTDRSILGPTTVTSQINTYDSDYHINGTSTMTTSIPGFKALPFEKMGMTLSSDEIKSFIPDSEITEVAPGKYYDVDSSNKLVALKWNDTCNANYYKVTIADNPEFTNAIVNYAVIPYYTADFSSFGDCDTYYWKVEAISNTKLYGTDYQKSAVFSFSGNENMIDVTSVTPTVEEFVNSESFNVTAELKNNTNTSFTPVVIAAMYDKNNNFVSLCKDDTKLLSEKSTEAYTFDVKNPNKNIVKIKIFVWNNIDNISPYSFIRSAMSK